MQKAPIPTDEKERLEAVHRLGILDTNPEERFDTLTKQAVDMLKVPISTIAILDDKREWFKSCQGLPGKEGERAISFCGHALLTGTMLVVEDTLKDERFADNPMVVGPPFIRFYAGQALLDYKSGKPVGVFCIKDIKPRTLSTKEIGEFMEFANKAEEELNK